MTAQSIHGGGLVHDCCFITVVCVITRCMVKRAYVNRHVHCCLSNFMPWTEIIQSMGNDDVSRLYICKQKDEENPCKLSTSSKAQFIMLTACALNFELMYVMGVISMGV